MIYLFGSFGQLVFVFVDRGDGDHGDGVFDSDSPIRVIRSTLRWLMVYLFGSFGQLVFVFVGRETSV